MDFDDCLEEWGTNIGSACDAILNSDCSLVGGLYHVTPPSGNLWTNTDWHLGINQHTEELMESHVPEPFAEPRFSPRLTSVAKYMHMDLSKIARPESTDNTCPPTAEENRSPTSEASKQVTQKIKTMDVRPKSSDDIGRENRPKPKFFRLGEYAGTRPYSADSGLHKSRKVRQRLPYFPEIQLQHQEDIKSLIRAAVGVRDKSCHKTPGRGIDMAFAPETDKDIKTSNLINAYKDNTAGRANQNTDEIDDGCQADRHLDAVKVHQNTLGPQIESPESIAVSKSGETVPRKQKRHSGLKSADKVQADKDILAVADIKSPHAGNGEGHKRNVSKIRRLGNSLRGLRDRVQSLFTSCLSCAK